MGVRETESCRNDLERVLRRLVGEVGFIRIGDERQFPFGWRKAAKGRTVWRLVEETVSQTLEANAEEFGLDEFRPSVGEVSIYDFSYSKDRTPVFINVKSAVAGRAPSKDDISKARLIRTFFATHPDCVFLIATIEIGFSEKPFGLNLTNAYVVPLTWLPDIYVNPSNNGNLQSSRYKDIAGMVHRTNTEFIIELEREIKNADRKRGLK